MALTPDILSIARPVIWYTRRPCRACRACNSFSSRAFLQYSVMTNSQGEWHTTVHDSVPQGWGCFEEQPILRFARGRDIPRWQLHLLASPGRTNTFPGEVGPTLHIICHIAVKGRETLLLDIFLQIARKGAPQPSRKRPPKPRPVLGSRYRTSFSKGDRLLIWKGRVKRHVTTPILCSAPRQQRQAGGALRRWISLIFACWVTHDSDPSGSFLPRSKCA